MVPQERAGEGMNEIVYPLATSTWDGLEQEAIERVVQSGKFTMGMEVRKYESSFAQWFGSSHAVMSNSGSSANLLALAALKYSSFNPGPQRTEVIVPAVSWSTTYYPIAQMGFKLRFVDVDLETLNASAESISQAIGPNTAGVVVVNLLGNPSELFQIRALADEYELFMVEDNCESMGAELEGKQAGTFGDVGTFSSFFSHHISTMEGGMSLTGSEELRQVMTSLRAHGWTRELPDENYVHNKTGEAFDDLFRFVLPGYNVRPIEFEGAIGQEQLMKLKGLLAGRKVNAQGYLSLASNFDFIRVQREYGSSSWFGFSLILEGRASGRRSNLVTTLSKHGIESRPIVAGNFTRNPVMRHLDHIDLGPLPNSDKIHNDGLFLGNHHFDLSEQFLVLEKALSEFSNSLSK